MLIWIIKIIILAFAIFSITKSYLDYKKKRETRVMFWFWAVVWLIAAVIAVYPVIIEQAIALTKDQTITFGTIISFAFIFQLYIVYRVYTKAARIEFQQHELIRKLGLDRSGKKK